MTLDELLESLPSKFSKALFFEKCTEFDIKVQTPKKKTLSDLGYISDGIWWVKDDHVRGRWDR